jgi:septal ring factor EnvC (AmiA/AmiB activator)
MKIMVLVMLVFLAQGHPGPAFARDAAQIEKELEQISRNLRRIEAALAKNIQDLEVIQRESENLDREIGRLHKQLKKSAVDIQVNEKTLFQLEQEKHELDKKYISQKKQFRHQLQAAYSLHSQSKWKLLLSQKNLQNVGRNAVIYDYLNNAQQGRLEKTVELSRQIESNQQSLQAQQQKLAGLITQQAAEQNMLMDMRKQKKQAQIQLEALIDKDSLSLSQETQKKESLQSLLHQLREKQQAAPRGSFSKQSGKLAWPIKGKLIQYFGEAQQNVSGAQSTGVKLEAARGTEIQAIFPGTVIFADWFDHYGWLMIIDHGDEYMSLYAHAEGLYKNVGDYVTQGETIAVVGDSGDTDTTLLYFEIRRQGTPVDPAKWCMRS